MSRCRKRPVLIIDTLKQTLGAHPFVSESYLHSYIASEVNKKPFQACV